MREPMDPTAQRNALRTRVDPLMLELPRFRVEVVAGRDKGLAVSGDAEERRAERLFVGTSEACDLRLTDPLVSRRHAAIAAEPGRLRIFDLSSTNGSLLNGVPIVEAFAYGGEILTVGDTQLRIELAEPSAAKTAPTSGFGRFVGASPQIRQLYPLLARLSQSAVPVILEGETGTGKEMLAEAIHECGPRAAKPYVVFDCTVGPPSLLESMLFGHEKGAYTGATASRPGVFEQANGGTLLIDEIGDLDVNLQAKLLRAVQRGEVQRLGGQGWIKVDVRILAATRRDLEREIQAGRFRDDLYYRLAVARVELPPLRHRTGDVQILAEHFWSRLGGVGPMPDTLVDRFEEYSWPGNVRELFNAVAHVAALGDMAQLDQLARARRSMPPALESGPLAGDLIAQVIAEGLPYPRARDRVLAQFDQQYVRHVLDKHGGNVTKAAAASGIGRRYFHAVKARIETPRG